MSKDIGVKMGGSNHIGMYSTMVGAIGPNRSHHITALDTCEACGEGMTQPKMKGRLCVDCYTMGHRYVKKKSGWSAVLPELSKGCPGYNSLYVRVCGWIQAQEKWPLWSGDMFTVPKSKGKPNSYNSPFAQAVLDNVTRKKVVAVAIMKGLY